MRPLHLVLLASLALPLGVLADPDPAESTGVSPARRALLSITAADIHRHVSWLADDARQGRDSGSPGERAAGEYIARHFARFGLKPAGVDGTWFQPFPLGTTAGLGKQNWLRVGKGDALTAHAVKTEFAPFAFSADGAAAGDLVFAGYGITAPAEKYDDYAGFDVTGKVVLIVRHEPRADKDGDAFAGKRHTRHAWFATKVELAQKRGAAAVVIVSNPTVTGDDDPLFGFHGSSDGNTKIPVLHAKIALAEQWFRAAGKDFHKHLAAIDEQLKPASFALGLRAEVASQLLKQKVIARNVLGLLEGSDPELKAEIVVVGGHYDHVGLGYFGSRMGHRARGKIHNGADDNASGTSGVLEVAEAFHVGGLRPRRSILFMAFSGEERGLVGSKYYVDNPTFPLERHVAMLNLDMIGRNSTGKFSVNGIGTSPVWPPLVKKINQALGTEATYGESGYAPSDNTSFYNKKIPVLFFFSGLHPDYHAPTDTADKINRDQAQHIARFCFAVTHYVTTVLDERPAVIFKPRGGRARGVRLGIQVADVRATDGIRIGRVVPGSPAQNAGLREGDVIVKLGNDAITDMRSLSGALRGRKAGDIVDVVVRRGDQTLTIKLTLASR